MSFFFSRSKLRCESYGHARKFPLVSSSTVPPTHSLFLLSIEVAFSSRSQVSPSQFPRSVTLSFGPPVSPSLGPPVSWSLRSLVSPCRTPISLSSTGLSYSVVKVVASSLSTWHPCHPCPFMSRSRHCRCPSLISPHRLSQPSQAASDCPIFLLHRNFGV
jgi:hypothetical protein